MRRLLFAATCLTTLFATAMASAQAFAVAAQPSVDPARVARLDKTLAELGEDSGGSEALVVLSLLAGVGYTGIGAAIAMDPEQEPRNATLRGFVVTESLIIGGICFGFGAYGLATWGTPSTGALRYARFRRDQRAGQLNLFKLGQYEGELYRDALMARSGRRSAGFLSLAVGAAGGGLIALAATSDMRGEARTLTYLEGGAFLPLGTIFGILLLASESAEERLWRTYRTGAPTTPVARWSVHPVVTSNGFVLAGGASL